MKYDIIGDIHGHADRLTQLLEKMGYRDANGTCRHPDSNRKAIFVGDFIDRGPNIKDTLEIVKSMVENEAALAVMGNHEYNAICFHTRKDSDQSTHLRPHTEKNVKQHSETLCQFENDESEWKAYLSWFRTLPLFLDLCDLRVVHAAWIPSEIRKISQWTSATNKLNENLLQKSAEEGSDVFKTVETVLKGVELPLPETAAPLRDKEGHSRKNIRVKWWEAADGKTFEDVLFPADPEQDFGGHLIPADGADRLPVYSEKVPVFFGHYWIDPENFKPPSIQADHICCLDYSVAKDGLLAAYQWKGEKTLRNDRFVWV